MKRIVLFVEGESDADALPKLVKKLLNEQHAWSSVTLDENPFRVGEANKLMKDGFREWQRFLSASAKRPNVGGVLLVLDGDVKKVAGRDFCAATVAKSLAEAAKKPGGGVLFSVAVVFARQEYESWLIAGIESLAGKQLPDGRKIAATAKAPAGNLEDSPRDAKGWLGTIIEGGYKESRDQEALTKLVELSTIRTRCLRSFRRLEAALSQLVLAVRNQQPVVSPR
jgi:hypothetical protein